MTQWDYLKRVGVNSYQRPDERPLGDLQREAHLRIHAQTTSRAQDIL
jgi:hypothetical protein